MMNPATGVYKFGEIGGECDLFYTFKKGSTLGGQYGTKLALNLAMWYNLKAKYSVFDANGDYKPNYQTEYLSFGEKYFSDYNLEITKKLSPHYLLNCGYIKQYFNQQMIAGSYQPYVVKTDILFWESTLTFPKSKSIIFLLEHMWADNDRKNWVSASLEYHHNQTWSVFASDMYNYGYDSALHTINSTDPFKIHFYNCGVTYSKNSTHITLGGSRQRGGLVCVGGICRYVPPSTGVNLNVSFVF